MRFVWAGENAAITLRCAPKLYQTSVPRPPLQGTLERFVCGENVIRPQTDPTAKRTAHFWTKPAAVVSCAVHYEEVFVGSLQFSMAGRGQTWGCEEVRSLIEIWWLAMRLRHLQCINTLFSSRICASFSKVIYCLKWYIQTM